MAPNSLKVPSLLALIELLSGFHATTHTLLSGFFVGWITWMKSVLTVVHVGFVTLSHLDTACVQAVTSGA